VIGVVIIAIVLVVAIPVAVLMSGGVLAAIIGQLLGRDADTRHAGSELAQLDD